MQALFASASKPKCSTASKAHVHTQGMLTCACGALGVCRGCQGLGALQHMAEQGVAGSADILVVS